HSSALPAVILPVSTPSGSRPFGPRPRQKVLQEKRDQHQMSELPFEQRRTSRSRLRGGVAMGRFARRASLLWVLTFGLALIAGSAFNSVGASDATLVVQTMPHAGNPT